MLLFQLRTLDFDSLNARDRAAAKKLKKILQDIDNEANRPYTAEDKYQDALAMVRPSHSLLACHEHTGIQFHPIRTTAHELPRTVHAFVHPLGRTYLTEPHKRPLNPASLQTAKGGRLVRQPRRLPLTFHNFTSNPDDQRSLGLAWNDM